MIKDLLLFSYKTLNRQILQIRQRGKALKTLLSGEAGLKLKFLASKFTLAAYSLSLTTTTALCEFLGVKKSEEEKVKPYIKS
jgi:hypothetical protein